MLKLCPFDLFYITVELQDMSSKGLLLVLILHRLTSDTLPLNIAVHPAVLRNSGPAMPCMLHTHLLPQHLRYSSVIKAQVVL